MSKQQATTSTTEDTRTPAEIGTALREGLKTLTLKALHIAERTSSGRDGHAETMGVLAVAARAAIDAYQAEMQASLKLTYRLLDDLDAYAAGRKELPDACLKFVYNFDNSPELIETVSPIQMILSELAIHATDPRGAGWNSQRAAEMVGDQIGEALDSCGPANRIYAAVAVAVAEHVAANFPADNSATKKSSSAANINAGTRRSDRTAKQGAGRNDRRSA